MNRKSSLVAFLFLLVVSGFARADDPATPGPHKVEKTDLPVTTKDGKKIPVEIVLPENVKGPLPVIFISHGWTDVKSSFASRAEHYASRGFAAVLVEQPDRRENDLRVWVANMRTAIDAVETAVKKKGSPLEGKVDFEKVGLEGHSYGGATAIVTASEDPRIKAVVADAPGAPAYILKFYDAATKVAVPIQIQGGQLDTVVPAKIFARPAYDRANAAPSKLYIEIKGANHLSWSDNPLLRPARALTSFLPSFFSTRVFVDFEDALRISFHYSTAWFEEKLGVKDHGTTLDERTPGLSRFDSRPARTSGFDGVLGARIDGARAEASAEDR